ncbi:hypothetical protein TSAR_007328 [Trichomalopsis sarcophagae]|uniref:TGF-beta family profile domain-containing protein n=1 Tax=Trichomalopsis sarcophagae TaxID=543379 RepID=A0A232FIL1_9HYME|nr:hypothetical protein TSAR_007328 [Trichomalopsis sarcophagae]
MGCKELQHETRQQQQQQFLSSADLPPVPLLILLIVLHVLANAAESALVALPEDDIAASVQDIRSSMVEALGLRRIPDPSKANVSQAEYERAHREYLTRLRRSAEGDARQRRLFTMYATEEEPPTLATRRDEPVRLNFPLSIENKDNALVESATLRLLLEHEEPDDDELEVRLYRRRRGSRRRLLTRQPLRQLASRLQRRWLEFDISEEVAAALAGSEELQLTLQLIRLEKGVPSRNVRASSAALNIHAFYPDNDDEIWPHERTKRSARELHQLMSLHRGRRTECRGEAKKCCRHHMSVTFKDLEGFDFIIQPKNFDAGYCKGRCPPRYNPAHHHALLQSLIWKEDRKKAPRPCCAPSKLAELEILYFDENDATKLKVSNWKDMRVIECACS